MAAEPQIFGTKLSVPSFTGGVLYGFILSMNHEIMKVSMEVYNDC